MKVFVSHSSHDKKFVKRLKRDLQSHYFTTWIDEDRILKGGSIASGVAKGLEEADVLLACLSKTAVLSGWVSTEWQTKLVRHMNDKKVSVIPIRLDDTPIPQLLIDKAYVDFRQKAKYEQSFSQLLGTLNKLRNSAPEEKGKPPACARLDHIVIVYRRQFT
jgi:hypothetical protein